MFAPRGRDPTRVQQSALSATAYIENIVYRELTVHKRLSTSASRPMRDGECQLSKCIFRASREYVTQGDCLRSWGTSQYKKQTQQQAEKKRAECVESGIVARYSVASAIWWGSEHELPNRKLLKRWVLMVINSLGHGTSLNWGEYQRR